MGLTPSSGDGRSLPARPVGSKGPATAEVNEGEKRDCVRATLQKHAPSCHLPLPAAASVLRRRERVKGRMGGTNMSSAIAPDRFVASPRGGLSSRRLMGWWPKRFLFAVAVVAGFVALGISAQAGL